MTERRRFSSREARDEVVAAGHRLLLERGVEAGLGRVTLQDAVSESGVPRASAYRAFSTGEGDPQDVFRLAVVTKLIESIEPDVSGVLDVIAPAIMNPSETPEERAVALREIVRLWTDGNLQTSLADSGLRALDAIAVAATVDPIGSAPVLESVRRSHERSHQAFLPLYKSLIDMFGLRLRPGLSIERLASMFRASMAMAQTEWILQPTHRYTSRPTGVDGTLVEWTFVGIVIEGLVLACFESDPDAVVKTDLSSWLSSSSTSSSSS